MPGILPMKVIKVGTSSQSRIAQACDRCRSKKIRCDGIRPTCSQCSNVGFECKTSDKLSRRAFPRGYTESLEERVRQLESEVRELKDLLDEKDEKIDMLSKMHSHRQPSVRSSPSPKPTVEPARDVSPPAKQDVFRVQATSLLLGVENSDSYFMGSSSGRSFIEIFKRKVQENGKPCGDFNLEAFLHIQRCYPLVEKSPSQSLRIPPRIFSDKCVNVYFQEWAPIFPILHRPTFLHIYEEFATDPDKIKNNYKLAQLYLVFSIASLSSDMPDLEQIAACELQWQKALDAIMLDNTMYTLQCLVLAIVYCAIRADYKRLQLYKAIAVGLSHRLGLHQSQKRFSFGALTIETRKKVFWSLYSLDCFSAAILGLPKLLKEDDIYTEYPSDTDDEYVTEEGFQPTLPGEHTRISSALALFKLSRVLARVLQEIYPAASSHELSLQRMSSLDAELQAWDEALPAHLRLNFAQDKPSTDITGSRSPILALAYYYVRVLIHRPAIGSSLGAKAASALLTTVDSSKHIIQIVQLLEERSMSFSICLNKTDVLVLCAMTLLYQSLELKLDSKLMKDIEKLINAVLGTLQKARAAGITDLKKIARMLIMVSESPQSGPTLEEAGPATTMTVPSRTSPSNINKPQSGRNIEARSSEATRLLSEQERLRRMTIPSSSAIRPERCRVPPRTSFNRTNTEQSTSQQSHPASIGQIQQANMRISHLHRAKSTMDYHSLSNATASNLQPSPPTQDRLSHLQSQPISTSHDPHHPLYPLTASGKAVPGGDIPLPEWEALLIGAMDGDQVNVYDAIYGATPLPLETPTSAATDYTELAPDPWDLPAFGIGDLDLGTNAAGPHSALSVSDESLSSGDDVSNERHIHMNTEDISNGSILRRNGHGGSIGLEGRGVGLRL